MLLRCVQNGPWSNLNPDILVAILSALDGKERWRQRMVCKQWAAAAESLELNLIRHVQAAQLTLDMLEASQKGSKTSVVTFQLSEALRVEELQDVLEKMCAQVCHKSVCDTCCDSPVHKASENPLQGGPHLCCSIAVSIYGTATPGRSTELEERAAVALASLAELKECHVAFDSGHRSWMQQPCDSFISPSSSTMASVS